MKYNKAQIIDLCTLVTSGGTPLTSVPAYYDPQEISWLKTGEVNYCRIYNTESYISKEGLARSSAKLVPPNSVIVAMYGQGDTAGRVAINKIPLSTNQACCNLIINHDIADYEFVYYALYSLYDHLVALKNGGAQPNLNAKRIKTMEIPFPDIEIQHRIASILSAYDDLIDNNKKQIKLLEEAAQRLYKEWFVDLRCPGYENTPIVDGLPEGWSYKPLSDLFRFVRGKSYTSKELSDTSGVLMVNLKNIRAFGGYNRNAEKRFTGIYKNEQSLNPGDLIMGVTDMTQERRLVGHAAIVPDLGEPMTFSMDLIKLLPVKIQKSYLYSTLFFGGFSKKISPIANGVNVLHLKPEAMMSLQMLVPTSELMDVYEQMFSPIQSRIELLQKQMDVAKEARDRLLPKLMSGEIEV